MTPQTATTDRRLHRSALLLFPKHVLRDDVLARIVDEGFTHVGAGVMVTPTMKDQGFRIADAQQLTAMCERHGLKFIAFTGYQKYQAKLLHDEPHRLMRFAHEGEVKDLDGLSVRWMCPFRPENIEHYIDLLHTICKWPALCEIHLNDEAGLGFGNGMIGCYCDYCTDRFAQDTGEQPPTTADWDSPLWVRWIESRMDNWVALHAELRDRVKAVRPDVRVGIQHSPYVPERIYNAWQSGVCLARDAMAQDVIATDPYHYNHADGIRYRPHRRIVSETTRSLVGACIDSLADIYPQGFMPPAQAVPMGRQDGILAGVVPFALGADLVMPYTYELMRIIPGFFEGFQDAARLLEPFASHRPYAFATMLMPQQSEIYGHHHTNWAGNQLTQMVDMVYRTGMPWRWFWDQRLDDAGDRLTGPLILPETHCLTASQLARVDAVSDRGEGALFVGNAPDKPWPGRGAWPLPDGMEYRNCRIELTGSHPLTAELDDPIIVMSRTACPARFADGQVLGTIDGEPALVVRDDGAQREAWIAGIPAVHYFGEIAGASGVEPTANAELLRRILLWLAGRMPVAWLAPFPPEDAYRSLRPRDRRAVPTVELLPMVDNASDGEHSLLAVVFPYTPVAATTSLFVAAPDGKRVDNVVDLWTGDNWTDRLEPGDAATTANELSRTADERMVSRIPLDIKGDCELLALKVSFA